MQIYAFYSILFTGFLPEQNRPHQSLALLEVKSKILDDIIFRLCVCGRVQRIDGVLGVAQRSGVCVGMRVVLRCGGYFTVSHQVCRHSDRDASRLQIGKNHLYKYNNANYIDSKDDYAGYRSQLIESEAFYFGDAVKQIVSDSYS